MGPGTHHEQMLTMFGVRLGKHGLRDREGTIRWTCLQVRRVVPLSPTAPSAVPLKLLRKAPYSTCWLRLRVMSRLRFGLAGPARQTSRFRQTLHSPNARRITVARSEIQLADRSKH